MKKISLVLIACGLIAGVSYAGPIDEVKSPAGVAVMKTGSTFKVFYRGESSRTVRVSIYNSNRDLVFHETLKKVDSFVRPYNFSSLPEGDYTIEVADGSSCKVEKVSYRNKKVQRAVTVKLLEDGRYILSVPNKGFDILKIRILSSAGAELYRSTETITDDFAKIYRLDGISGKVSFEIQDKNGTVKALSY